jgi:hypothetical protein
MAADTPDDGEPDAAKAGGTSGLNSPFRGSLPPAELTGEVGRWLQSQHPVSLTEPLPDELASLIQRLRERKDAAD